MFTFFELSKIFLILVYNITVSFDISFETPSLSITAATSFSLASLISCKTCVSIKSKYKSTYCLDSANVGDAENNLAWLTISITDCLVSSSSIFIIRVTWPLCEGANIAQSLHINLDISEHSGSRQRKLTGSPDLQAHGASIKRKSVKSVTRNWGGEECMNDDFWFLLKFILLLKKDTDHRTIQLF